MSQPTMEAPTADPAAMPPTTLATEAASDPIRPTGTDALMAESRPELTASTDEAGMTNAAGPSTAMPTEEKAEENSMMTESQPMAEGILGYKAPGLVKSLRFAKKFFWFKDEAVEPQSLTNYLRGEKPEIGHANAAYASQTGKGLLFFAKRVEDKSQPAGILNLSEVSDITKEGLNEFFLKLHGHKHTFQAATSAERDNWLAVVESKASEAKASRGGILDSEGYKNHINSLGKPTALAAASGAAIAAKSSTTPQKNVEEKAASDVPIATGSTETAPKAAVKSRSQSRKRQSLFGKVLGKKEEHEEMKENKVEQKEMKKDEKAEQKEMKKEEKAEEKEMKKEEKAEKKEEKVEEKAGKMGLKDEKKEIQSDSHTGDSVAPPLDAAAVASRAVAEPVVPTGEPMSSSTGDIPQPMAEPNIAPSAATTRETAPKPTKRSSVFGSLFGKKDNASPTRERKEKDTMPAVPAKDNETAPLSEMAPQLEDPMATSSNQPAEEVTAPAASPTSPNTAPSESKGGIFGFMKQKEPQQEKKDMKEEEKVDKDTEAPTMATDTPVNPDSETPAPASMPTAAAPTSALDTPKEKRRQSFFGTIASKKERKTDATSDAEMTDGEGKKSAAGKLGGIFRKASRSTKGSSGPMTDSSTPPAPISKDTPTSMDAMPATEPAAATMANETTDPAMIEKPTESTMPEGMGSQQTAVSASA